MSIHYEWIVEELENDIVTDDPDIYDTYGCDSLEEAINFLKRTTMPARLALTRNVGNDLDGLTDRAWAYVVNNKLPETFSYGADIDSGIKVPAKYIKALETLAMTGKL